MSMEESAIVIVESCFRCFILFAFKPEVYLEPLLLEAKHISWKLLLQQSGIDKLTFLSTPVKISVDRNIPLNFSKLFTSVMYKML